MTLDADAIAAEARELKAEIEASEGATAAEDKAPSTGEGQADGRPGGGAPGGDQPREGEYLPNPGREIAAVAKLVRDFPLVRKMLGPRTLAVLTDVELDRLGDALGAVAVKYGWNLHAVAAQWEIELRALIVTGALAYQLAEAIKADREDAKPAPGGSAVHGDAAGDPPPQVDGVVEPGARAV